ncbi:PQQ-dependent sugar dehydrogenase [Sphingobacterium sp. LRF_L2]|uniref:PQQ-dependent sugar dehydrogenase n=1 Tax=Sphingobacterium sp. LRF_L2 TaxID=3369421 RepID=UPI003F617567
MKDRIYIYIILVTATFYSCNKPNRYQKSVDDYLQLDSTVLEVTTVADSLHVPWEMVYHNNKIIFTEIAGKVKQLDLHTGHIKTILEIPDVYQKRTTGLLGLALSKNDATAEPYIFLTYTSKKDSTITSNLVRYQYQTDTLINPKKLLQIKGNTAHNGTRLYVDQHNIIYWATGDAYDFPLAQDSTSLNGKILRLTIDGSIPKDNPIPNSYVYAWGFRNMQGLAIDEQGNIFTSEHGEAIEDEINAIYPLHNYGWPLIEGKHDLPAELELAKHKKLTQPIRSWTPVIAPSGLAFYSSDQIPEWKNSLILATLKSQTLRVLKLSEDRKQITHEHIYFSNRYGRLRAVMVAPNGDIFLSTSNRDWNPQKGFPKASDDKILRLSITNKTNSITLHEDKPDETKKAKGDILYKNYCASCHKEDGLGVKNTFPPLVGSQRIRDSQAFVDVILNGLDGKKPINGILYGTLMPSFSFLKDEELVEIINYVNRQFADGKEIGTDMIKKRR